jgi:hypothetical protein
VKHELSYVLFTKESGDLNTKPQTFDANSDLANSSILQLCNVLQIHSSLMYEKQEMSYLNKCCYNSVELHYNKY